jgi:putative endonuclease
MCVYILASHKRGALYVGVTNNLARRVEEHRIGVVDSFTRRYGIHHLVWFEAHDSVEAAITREKRLKTWLRAWKIRLIEESNPEWRDLAAELD